MHCTRFSENKQKKRQGGWVLRVMAAGRRRMSVSDQISVLPTDVYTRKSVIGRGAFSVVWLAQATGGFGEQVVVKDVALEAMSEEDREAAISEVVLHSQLNHRHIIRYIEVIRPNPSQLSIVLEYAVGGDLSEFLKKRASLKNPLHEKEALVWFAQVLSAVDYLHKRDMIHRDIKAANIFISADGTTKLGDFNLSKTLECNAKRTSERSCSTPCGTPMYNAPERWIKGGYTQQVDIWSLGCLFYEMLLLQPAFVAPNMDALYKTIHSGTYNKALLSSVSVGVREILFAMLAHDPRRRPRADMLLKEGIIRDVRSHLFIPPEIGGPGLIVPEGGPGPASHGAASHAAPRRRSSVGKQARPSIEVTTGMVGFMSLETVAEISAGPASASTSTSARSPAAAPAPAPASKPTAAAAAAPALVNPTPHRPPSVVSTPRRSISRPASRGNTTVRSTPSPAPPSSGKPRGPFIAAARATRAVITWPKAANTAKAMAGSPLPPIKPEPPAKALSVFTAIK
eukprot:m.229646 g.229646  ORF g.229646 m.229646 type:complete len:512 (-) comp17794_c0_seq1:524-2059(-)